MLLAASVASELWQTVSLVPWGDGRFGWEAPRLPAAQLFRSADHHQISEVTRHPTLIVDSAPLSTWRVETSRLIGGRWEPWTPYTNFTTTTDPYVWVDREHSVSPRLLYRLRPLEALESSEAH